MSTESFKSMSLIHLVSRERSGTVGGRQPLLLYEKNTIIFMGLRYKLYIDIINLDEQFVKGVHGHHGYA